MQFVVKNVVKIPYERLDQFRNYLQSSGIRLGRVNVVAKPGDFLMREVTIEGGINPDEADQLRIALLDQPTLEGMNGGRKRFEWAAEKISGPYWKRR